jgi:F420-non-reducing hydrogenase small subunit
MAENSKFKLAMYWAAACGGCEISVLNIAEKILDVAAAFDIVFWPVAIDFKYSDVHNYPDDFIDVCLFNGAIRNSENEEIACLLRRKSKLLVAFGSCATMGGIPALANLTDMNSIFQTVYLDNPSIDNPEGILPQPKSLVKEGDLEGPIFYNTVKSLEKIVEVDYFIPGCPPEPHQIWSVLEVVVAALQGNVALPPKGSVLGANGLAVCQECEFEKNEKQINRFFRPYEIVPDPTQCLLEQGLLCLGPATRGGCGALCPKVGIGCRGCYGGLEGVEDQGVRFLSAIASVIDAGSTKDKEIEIERKIGETVATLEDPAGTFYRFSLSNSLLTRARMKSKKTIGEGGVL